MVRAIFFDFYSVWTPDKFSYYLAAAELNGPEIHRQLSDLVNDYYHGRASLEQVADTFKVRLGHPDLSVEQFKLSVSDISPQIINLMQNLHVHFLKLGVLADLGMQELEVLKAFDEKNKLFEVIVSPLTLQTDLPLYSQEVFAQALQEIGEPPSNTIVVSGNTYYLDFAAALGIQTLQFDGLSNLMHSLEQLLSSETPTAQ